MSMGHYMMTNNHGLKEFKTTPWGGLKRKKIESAEHQLQLPVVLSLAISSSVVDIPSLHPRLESRCCMVWGLEEFERNNIIID